MLSILLIMKKKIIQIRDYLSFVTVEGENGSNVAENSNYELLFDDKTSVIVDSKICDGKMLCIGDEVFIYNEVNLISRTPLSPQELKKMIRQKKSVIRSSFLLRCWQELRRHWYFETQEIRNISKYNQL